MMALDLESERRLLENVTANPNPQVNVFFGFPCFSDDYVR
jgi:hypothetical protein